MKKTITALVFLASLACFGQQYSQKYSDVNYVGEGQGYHNLDIYLPKATQTKYPVVVYIYGSAWYSNNGKGADMNTVGAALLDAGFAVVTPNHRSSSDAKFPAQSHDIKAVIRFIRGNASKYKFDTSFIASSGSSSGGHLASLMGTTNGVKNYTVGTTTMDLEGTLGSYKNFSSKVNAVVDFFGPIDFTRMENCNTFKGADSPEAAIIGGAPAQNVDKAKLLSPITYVDPTDPPILIFHGGQDNVVPYCQSQFFYDKFQSVGVVSEFVFVPNGQHGPNVNDTQADLQKMVQFLTKQKSVVTGLEEFSPTSTKIFPNPFNSNGLNINIQDDFSYCIYDMSGHEVEVGHGSNFQTVGQGLDKGIYILKVQGNNFKAEYKIIRQ
jgi:acetyl esterase/lipase